MLNKTVNNLKVLDKPRKATNRKGDKITTTVCISILNNGDIKVYVKLDDKEYLLTEKSLDFTNCRYTYDIATLNYKIFREQTSFQFNDTMRKHYCKYKQGVTIIGYRTINDKFEVISTIRKQRKITYDNVTSKDLLTAIPNRNVTRYKKEYKVFVKDTGVDQVVKERKRISKIPNYITNAY